MIRELVSTTKALETLGMKQPQIDALSRHFIALNGVSADDWEEIVKIAFKDEQPRASVTTTAVHAIVAAPAPCEPSSRRCDQCGTLQSTDYYTSPEATTCQKCVAEGQGMKWCPICKQLLPKDAFWKNNAERDKLMRYCSTCLSKRKEQTRSRRNATIKERTIAELKSRILGIPELPLGKPPSWHAGNTNTIPSIAFRIGAPVRVTKRALTELEREHLVDKTMVSSITQNGRPSKPSMLYWKIPQDDVMPRSATFASTQRSLLE